MSIADEIRAEAEWMAVEAGKKLGHVAFHTIADKARRIGSLAEGSDMSTKTDIQTNAKWIIDESSKPRGQVNLDGIRMTAQRISDLAEDIPDAPPEPVDCLLSDWALVSEGPWSECQSDGTRTREQVWARTVIREPAHGGKDCEPIEEVRILMEQCVYVPPDPDPQEPPDDEEPEPDPPPDPDPDPEPEPEPEPEPKPPTPGDPILRTAHPRLWITPDNRESIHANILSHWVEEFKAFVKELDAKYSGITTGTSNATHYAHGYAMLYALGAVDGISYGRTRDEYGQKARTLLTGFGSLSLPYHMLTYDWVHDLLTPTQRAQIVAKWKVYTEKNAWWSRTPLPSSARPLRSYWMLAGLAAAGDGIEDAWAAGILAIARRGLYWGISSSGNNEGHVSGMSWMAGKGFEPHTWGGSGSLDYWTKAADSNRLDHLWRTVEAYRTAYDLSDAEVYGDEPVCSTLASHLMLHVMPHRNAANRAYLWRMNPSSQLVAGLGDISHLFHVTAGIYQDLDPGEAGLAQWMRDSGTWPWVGATSPLSLVRAWPLIFVRGAKVAPRTTAAVLPLTARLEPLGLVISRPDWAKDRSSFVTFQSASYDRQKGTYTNVNNGAFTVMRNGPLLIGSGTTTHHTYHSRSYAFNTFVFVPPTVSPDDSGGAQRNPTTTFAAPSAQAVPGADQDYGGIKRYLADDENHRVYAYADVTRAYNSPQRVSKTGEYPKTDRFTRQFVYLKGTGQRDGRDRIVVFDRVRSSRPDIEKRSLLHPSAEPQVTTGTSTPGPSRNGSTAGRVTYTGHPIGGAAFEVVNTFSGAKGPSNGKLWGTVLLPTNPQIVKIGGPGHEFETNYGGNYAAAYSPDDAQYVGQWRLEIIPSDPETQDHEYLMSFEVTDADDEGLNELMLRLDGLGLVGCLLPEDIVLFGKMGDIPYTAESGWVEPPIHGGSVMVPQAGTYRLHVHDLVPDMEYRVQPDTVARTSEAGTLHATVELAGPGLVVIEEV